ncbi:efflux RND transporter permease subunit [Leptospira yanagawae]|uniref:Efflux RND transporter permease subunit n=1 Tax=Leptospira yanagawae TaxID=293069 RepID=A0ABY2M3H8_9LEPT|nr:efflux RND transporter permease subunit [Leptospira yanagawae]TGL23050.1 efflux RND transporter permease subunit [Leptospira yanagawae]
MNFLITLILKRKFLIGMLYSGLMLFGIIKTFSIPVSLFPQIEYPKLTIITEYENASASEVDNLVTKKIAEALGTLQKLKRIESESKEGYSFVHLTFKNETDISIVSMDIREKLDFIRDTLPYNTQKPIISKFDPNSKPLIQIAFSAKPRLNENDLRDYLIRNVKFNFDRVDGVALTQIIGGKRRRINITIDPLKLSSYGVQPEELDQLVKISNKNYPAGQLAIGNKELQIRAVGEFQNLYQLSDLVVSFRPNSGVIRIGDIAHLNEDFEEPSGYSRLNLNDSVILNIYKEPGKNSVTVSNEIRSNLSQIKKNLEKDIDLEIVYDESDFIENSINSLLQNLLLGAFLAFFVLLFLMRNIYSPSILILTIPTTLTLSFLFFDLFEIGFNIMSLGGLALGIGLLFDSSNVVLSAIERRLLTNEPLESSVKEGVSEVFESILTATLTSVIVFLPIGFLKNILGLVFSEMAFAISITLITSFIVSCTFVPLVVSILYARRRNINANNSKIIDTISMKYIVLLEKLIQSPKNLIVFIILLFVTSFLFLPFIKYEFFPEIHTGVYIIDYESKSGINLSIINSNVLELEKNISKLFPQITILTKVGIDKELTKWDSEESSRGNKAEIKIIGLEKEARSKIINLISEYEKKFDSKIKFTEESSGLEKLLSNNKKKSISVQSNSREILQNFALQIKRKFHDKISTDYDYVTQEYLINFQQDKLAKYGLTTESVSSFIRISLKGLETSEMKYSNQTLKLYIKMEKRYADSVDKIMFLRLKTPSNDFIPLREICNISLTDGERIIRRNSNLYSTDIYLNQDSNREILVSQIKSELINQNEVTMKEDGNLEDLNYALNEITISFLFATLLIFMLLTGIFESFKSSIFVMTSIPFIFIGVFPSLFFSGMSLNISSFMGFILVIGVVVDNSVLYFEYYKFYINNNYDKKLSILYAGKTIIRPILMNNSTTILGMLPILLSLSSGSEFQSPLALVVVSGLLTSLTLSLFVIPVTIYFFPSIASKYV